MQIATQALMNALAEDVSAQAKELSQKVRQALPDAALKELGAADHQRLTAAITEELESTVWSFLARLDNVGSKLPTGILGYTLTAKCGEPAAPIDVPVRVGLDDYSNTWLSYLDARSRRNTADRR
jgi:hypothetical protein